MDANRPPPLGDPSVVKKLRPYIFVGIEGAAQVYPKGLMTVMLARLLGWLGPLLTVHATDPLPPTALYIAVTPEDFRIFGRAMFSSPYEIGRWKRFSYRASVPDTGQRLKLDLELERLGAIRLVGGWRAQHVRPVFELVVQGASGPVSGM